MSFIQKITDKVNANVDSKVVVAFAAVATVGLIARIALAPKYGKKYENEDQKAIAESTSVVTSDGLREVRKITSSSQKSSAALALTTSDPIYSVIANEKHDPVSKKAALLRYNSYVLSYLLPTSNGAIALQTEKNDAIAVWFTKGANSVPSFCTYNLRLTGFARRDRINVLKKITSAARNRILAGEPVCYYLAKLGVSDVASAGSVEAVIKPILERADAKKLVSFVELTDVKGVAADVLFANGFKVVDTISFFGVEVQLLKRTPQ